MSTNINFNKKLGLKGNTGITLPTSSTPSFTNVNSFSFDGVDEYFLGTSTYSELDGQNKMTLSLWMKPISGAPLYEYVVTVPRNSTANEHVFSFQHFENNYLTFSIDGRTTRSVLGNISAITYGAWNHIMCVLDATLSGADRMKIYVNGVDETYQTSIGTFTALQNASGGLMIGEEPQGAYNPYRGLLDEVAIWSGTDQRANVSEIYGGGQAVDLNNLATAPQPTTWQRFGDNGAVWNGATWTMTDVNGGYTNRSINMVEANRTTDVPPNPFVNTQSILLDGVDDSISLSNITIDNTSFTFSMWIKPINSISNDMLIQKQSTPRNAMFGLQSVSGSFCALVSYYNNSSSVKVQSNNIAKVDMLNNWSHVVIVRNGLDSTFYLNGANIGGGTFASSQPSTIDIDKIGFGFNNWYFEGNIDEVSIFNSELSASDVTSIYNGGVPNDISSLNPLSWWRCGDGDTAPTLTDNGSGGNDGTMTNFSTFSTDVPTFSKRSIALDGVDDFVSVSNSNILDGLQKATWSFWFTKSGTSAKYLSSHYNNGNQFLFLFIPSSNRIDGYVNGVRAFANTSTTINVDTWYSAVFVLDSTLSSYSDRLKLFINGTQIANTGGATLPQNATLNSDSGDILIGKATTGFNWDGNIDEVSFWNDAKDISDIWNGSGLPTDLSSESNVIAWWRMGDGDTAPTITDNVGSADGTMTNFTTFSTDVPT